MLRRGRLLISRSCLREHYHALNQAAIPLIPLFRFPEPLLILYPGVGTFVLIRPTQTFYERIKIGVELSESPVALVPLSHFLYQSE